MGWLRDFSTFILPFLDRVPVVRAVLGFALVFFLPGFAWTLLFFKQLTVLERITMSFALSLVLVTFSLVFLNQVFGVRIDGLNSVLVIVVITVIPVLAYNVNRVIRRKRGKIA